MRMRRSLVSICTRAFLIIMLLYLMVPSSWVLSFFSRTKEESKTYKPSTDKSVPNIVHFIRFGKVRMTFIDAVCILAALKNQKPRKLYIHTDRTDYDEVWGKYWEVVADHPTASVIEVKHRRMPRSVFGKGFRPEFAVYHASDVVRLQILIEHGGIYLDNDSYVVRSLSIFFDFEMTLGWEDGGGISDQVLIAKRHARFLHMWLDSYRDYRRDEWFYNGGELPTKILKKRPGLVYAARSKLAEYKNIEGLVYYEDNDEWKLHYAIHLLINHQYILMSNISSESTYPVEFDENNILNYPVNIRQMALDVYPFDEKIKKRFAEIYPQLRFSTEKSRRGRRKLKRTTKSLGKLMEIQKTSEPVQT